MCIDNFLQTAPLELTKDIYSFVPPECLEEYFLNKFLKAAPVELNKQIFSYAPPEHPMANVVKHLRFRYIHEINETMVEEPFWDEGDRELLESMREARNKRGMDGDAWYKEELKRKPHGFSYRARCSFDCCPERYRVYDQPEISSKVRESEERYWQRKNLKM